MRRVHEWVQPTKDLLALAGSNVQEASGKRPSVTKTSAEP